MSKRIELELLNSNIAPGFDLTKPPVPETREIELHQILYFDTSGTLVINGFAGCFEVLKIDRNEAARLAGWHAAHIDEIKRANFRAGQLVEVDCVDRHGNPVDTFGAGGVILTVEYNPRTLTGLYCIKTNFQQDLYIPFSGEGRMHPARNFRAHIHAPGPDGSNSEKVLASFNIIAASEESARKQALARAGELIRLGHGLKAEDVTVKFY